jgi:hypothetical protein
MVVVFVKIRVFIRLLDEGRARVDRDLTNREGQI